MYINNFHQNYILLHHYFLKLNCVLLNIFTRIKLFAKVEFSVYLVAINIMLQIYYVYTNIHTNFRAMFNNAKYDLVSMCK